jgi:hypothetical protein
MRFEGNTSGLDEDMFGVQQRHRAVSQSQRAGHKAEMDTDPTRGLHQAALPLRDQGTGQRHQVKECARLINQCAQEHETGRHRPLCHGAPDTG